jgi:hypothetical protein
VLAHQVFRYCNKKCQAGDYKEHRHECQTIAKLAPRKPTPTLILASRLLRRVLVETSQLEGQMEGELPGQPCCTRGAPQYSAVLRERSLFITFDGCVV